MARMTIHEALAELKALDNKIANVRSEGTYVDCAKLSATKVNGLVRMDYVKKLQGSYDKIRGLMSRRNAIRLAVVRSNGEAMVTIDGIEISVAQAIVRKSLIEEEIFLLITLKGQYENAVNTLNKENGEKLENKLNTHLGNTIGNNYKENTRLAEVVSALSKDFYDNNAYGLIDPVNIGKVIEQMDAEINRFMTQVDSAISVSNALTYIEV